MQGTDMTSTHLSHAAMLQLIAEGMRSPHAAQLNAEQLQRVAGILDRIAVDLMVPVIEDDEDPVFACGDTFAERRLNG